MRRLLREVGYVAGVLFPRSRERWLTVREVAVMAVQTLLCRDDDFEKYDGDAPGWTPGTPPERPNPTRKD